MIRTKGEAGTGNVVEAVRHARAVHREIKRSVVDEDELFMFGTAARARHASATAALRWLVRTLSHWCDSLRSKQLGASYELVKKTKEMGRLPVVNFAAGGVATPADAALMMQLGVDGVFVGSESQVWQPCQARGRDCRGRDTLGPEGLHRV